VHSNSVPLRLMARSLFLSAACGQAITDAGQCYTDIVQRA